MGSFAYRRGVVDIGRCHCADVCFGAARVRIREGHCRDCSSSLRGIDAIECGCIITLSSTFRDAGTLGAGEQSVTVRRTNRN